jgi:hypothetical protein
VLIFLSKDDGQQPGLPDQATPGVGINKNTAPGSILQEPDIGDHGSHSFLRGAEGLTVFQPGHYNSFSFEPPTRG